MEIKTRAYVLRATDYKENDKLLTLFSLEYGKLTATLRGVKKPKAKFKFACQPFSLIEFVMAEKGGYYTVTQAQAIDAFFPLTADVEKFYAVSVMAQALMETLQEKQQDIPLFTNFGHTLGAMVYEKTDAKLMLTHFLSQLLLREGWGVGFSHCALCKQKLETAYFSLAEGGCFCKAHAKASAVQLKEEVFALLCAVENASVHHLVGMRCSVESARGALRLLADDFMERTGVSLPALNEYFTLFLAPQKKGEEENEN